MHAALAEPAIARTLPRRSHARPASTTVIYQDGHAIGVLALEVGGVPYDVQLAGGSYDAVFGDNRPSFFGRPREAVLARDAIVAAFNAEASPPGISPHPFPLVLTPFSDDIDPALFVAAAAGCSDCGRAWRAYEHSVEMKAMDFSAAPVHFGFLFATYQRRG